MKDGIFKVILISLIALVLVGVIFISIRSSSAPDFDLVSYLSIISGFLLALLTFFYVFTNNKQLNIMKQQLSEMKNDREMQNQPFPWIQSVKFTIEKPRLFFSPPENEHSFQSRYFMDIQFKNIGQCPAINTLIRTVISINNKSKESILYDTKSSCLHAIEEKGENNIHQMLLDDVDSLVLQGLLDNWNYRLKIEINVFYRNLLGGCFGYKSKYRIDIDFEKKEESEIDFQKIVKDWCTKIKTFRINYSKELEMLKYYKKNHIQEEHNILFDKVNEEISANNALEKITLPLYLTPNSLELKQLSRDEFNNFVGEKISAQQYKCKIQSSNLIDSSK